MCSLKSLPVQKGHDSDPLDSPLGIIMLFVSKHGTLHTDISALNEHMCSTFDFSICFPK